MKRKVTSLKIHQDVMREAKKAAVDKGLELQEFVELSLVEKLKRVKGDGLELDIGQIERDLGCTIE
jgi:hypothetical protein